MTPAKKSAPNAVYEGLAAEWGCTRQRVHQVCVRALEKLGLAEKRRKSSDVEAWLLHIERVTWRLDGALQRRRDARRSGDIRAEHAAMTEADELLDALTWLEARRDGTLETMLREAEERADEPTVYVATVHYTDALLPQPAAKWTSYALTAPRRK